MNDMLQAYPALWWRITGPHRRGSATPARWLLAAPSGCPRYPASLCYTRTRPMRRKSDGCASTVFRRRERVVAACRQS